MTPLMNIIVGANFVAHNLGELLTLSMTQLGWATHITILPPEELLPGLLNPEGTFPVTNDAIVILIDIERWIHPQGNIRYNPNLLSMKDFADALAFASKVAVAQCMLVLSCPPMPDHATDDVALAEAALATRLLEIPWIDFVDLGQFSKYYPFGNPDIYFDGYTNKLADIPYRSHGFAAIALMVSRALARRFRRPKKLLVVDCDNTLWSGNCGEDEHQGIRVTQDHQAFQDFLIDQIDGGRLLCLCSKNDPEAVWSAFDSTPTMHLRRHHITRARLNWNDKATNIKDLAADLDLSVNTVIFIDDDERECALVKSLLPEVTTVCLQTDSSKFMSIMHSVLDFDIEFAHAATILKRKHYHAKSQRPTSYTERRLSADEFRNGLDLRVTISTLGNDDVLRASELTYRTTQFNISDVKLTPLALKRLTASCCCKAVFAADRLGDYGLVGFMSYKHSNGKCLVEQFLLSCRALGKGIKDRCSNIFLARLYNNQPR